MNNKDKKETIVNKTMKLYEFDSSYFLTGQITREGCMLIHKDGTRINYEFQTRRTEKNHPTVDSFICVNGTRVHESSMFNPQDLENLSSKIKILKFYNDVVEWIGKLKNNEDDNTRWAIINFGL